MVDTQTLNVQTHTLSHHPKLALCVNEIKKSSLFDGTCGVEVLGANIKSALGMSASSHLFRLSDCSRLCMLAFTRCFKNSFVRACI